MNRMKSFMKGPRKPLMRLVFALLMLAGIREHADAQVDPHFSQYYIYPMALNPALTGTMDGDYRVSGIWRSQYGNTLTTRGVSADMITDKNTNFGFNLLNQATNDKSYNFTNAYVTMSYTGVRFGKSGYHYLGLALQCGVLNRRFDVSKLQFGSQWASGLGYDPAMSSGETFTKPSMYAFDAGVGVAYFDATPEKKVNLYGGVSAFHITRPKNTFLSAGSEDQVLPVRLSVHGGARITVSDLITLVPNALYVKQGQAEEKMIGTYAQLYVTETVDVMVGGNYRFQDALVPFAGFYYKGFTLGVSYDVNASKMSASSNRSNSFELSLSFVGKSKKEMKTRPFYCPRF